MIHSIELAVETTSYIKLFALARGGMGSVDLGLRTEGMFSRLVAIKRPKSGDEDDEQALRMFLDEASITGLIRHPNVVGTYDFGYDDSGPFLVMEYVEGNSLRTLLDMLESAEEQLPIQHALRILMDAARGLHAAHELKTVTGEALQVIHRDVSPGNLMLSIDGQCKVADFGIAKIWGKGTKTETGILKGKIGYLSPEQLRFQLPDHRADIYSLGVVLYEMVAGRRLHQSGDFREVAWKTIEGDIPDLGEARLECPPALVQLCAQMLAKDPEKRPATTKEIAERAAVIHREQIELEGADDFADYLQEFFDHELGELQARVKDVLAKTQTPEIQSGGQAPVVAPQVATRSAIVDLETFVRRKHKGRKRLLVVAALLGLVGLGWAAWSFVPGSTAETATGDLTPAIISEPESAPLPAIEAEDATPTELAPITVEVPESSAAARATKTRSNARRPRRRAKRRSRTAPKTEVSKNDDGELMEW